MGSPPLLPLILFVLTYIGLALGRIPGLALDRTGFAVLGAAAFLATGSISVEEAKRAVDAPTVEEPIPLHRPEATKAIVPTVAAIALFLSLPCPRR